MNRDTQLNKNFDAFRAELGEGGVITDDISFYVDASVEPAGLDFVSSFIRDPRGFPCTLELVLEAREPNQVRDIRDTLEETAAATYHEEWGNRAHVDTMDMVAATYALAIRPRRRGNEPTLRRHRQ